MRIWFSPYELTPQKALSAIHKGHKRYGALLKIEFDNGSLGYADCHPWPELGDADLESQLKALQSENYTELLRCSLRFAKLDANARGEGKNLLKNLSLPESHYLVTSSSDLSDEKIIEIREKGYSIIKLKVGLALDQEVNTLNSLREEIEFRLDFNSSITVEQAMWFWNQINPQVKERVQLIEDPCKYQLQSWLKLHQHMGNKLAIDNNWRNYDLKLITPPFSVVVIKPAVQLMPLIKTFARQNSLKILVTSYMDHPFGQVCAAYEAATMEPELLIGTGLVSHIVYEANKFSDLLKIKKARLQQVEGTGFGFDLLLKKLYWKELAK